MHGYPAFTPPIDLADRAPREWSAPEAERYRTWVASILPARVMALYRHFDVSPDGTPEQRLWRLGAKASVALPDAQFSVASCEGRQLTASGYALAIDLGLAVASELLAQHTNQLQWTVLRKPKSEQRYNRPVLSGFTDGQVLDPLGGSIAEASAVLRGSREADAWASIFSFWSQRAVSLTNAAAAKRS